MTKKETVIHAQKNKNNIEGLPPKTEVFKIGKRMTTIEANIQVIIVAKIVYEGSTIYETYAHIIAP